MHARRNGTISGMSAPGSTGFLASACVPLEHLEAALRAAAFRVHRDDTGLTVQHDHFVTRLDVVPPEAQASHTTPLLAAVTVRTELPPELAEVFDTPSTFSMANRAAAGGALTPSDGGPFVGARLTIGDGEQASASPQMWALHAQLLLSAMTTGAEALLGAVRVQLAVEPESTSASEWQPEHFARANNFLAKWCHCSCDPDERSLVAEFSLVDGPASAPGHPTALWQMAADQHPYLGGGLFCALSLPQRFEDAEVLDRVLMRLNELEMAPRDLAPHFGAWTRGVAGDNPAYCAFVTNPFESTPGVIGNLSVWALARARWAHRALSDLGYPAGADN